MKISSPIPHTMAALLLLWLGSACHALQPHAALVDWCAEDFEYSEPFMACGKRYVFNGEGIYRYHPKLRIKFGALQKDGLPAEGVAGSGVFRRRGFASAAAGDRFYFCGGEDLAEDDIFNGIFRDDLYCWDCDTGQWTQLATTDPSPGDARLMLVCGDNLYKATPGDSAAAKSVWCLDLPTLTWSQLPALPAGHQSTDLLCKRDGRLAVLEHGAAQDKLFVLNAAGDGWDSETIDHGTDLGACRVDVQAGSGTLVSVGEGPTTITSLDDLSTAAGPALPDTAKPVVIWWEETTSGGAVRVLLKGDGGGGGGGDSSRQKTYRMETGADGTVSPNSLWEIDDHRTVTLVQTDSDADTTEHLYTGNTRNQTLGTEATLTVSIPTDRTTQVTDVFDITFSVTPGSAISQEQLPGLEVTDCASNGRDTVAGIVPEMDTVAVVTVEAGPGPDDSPVASVIVPLSDDLSVDHLDDSMPFFPDPNTDTLAIVGGRDSITGNASDQVTFLDISDSLDPTTSGTVTLSMPGFGHTVVPTDMSGVFGVGGGWDENGALPSDTLNLINANDLTGEVFDNRVPGGFPLNGVNPVTIGTCDTFLFGGDPPSDNILKLNLYPDDKEFSLGLDDFSPNPLGGSTPLSIAPLNMSVAGDPHSTLLVDGTLFEQDLTSYDPGDYRKLNDLGPDVGFDTLAPNSMTHLENFFMGTDPSLAVAPGTPSLIEIDLNHNADTVCVTFNFGSPFPATPDVGITIDLVNWDRGNVFSMADDFSFFEDGSSTFSITMDTTDGVGRQFVDLSFDLPD